MSDDEDEPSLLEEKLAFDLLQATLEKLSARDLGAASCACQRWAEALSHPTAWRQAGQAEGLVWATDEVAEERAAEHGGWKLLLRRERALERRWKQYGLQPRVIAQGHDHWVPSILIQPRTRELVTCSYDGTVRFWSDADAAQPTCFKILTGADQEGFSSIAMWSAESGVPRLAAGSELGNVHVWEVWCPEDADDAEDAVAAARAATEAGTSGAAVASLDGFGAEPQEADGDVPIGGPPDARPHFARKLECWTGSHDFVQSILMLDGDTVVSGGDSGFVTLHQLGGEPRTDAPALRLTGHQSAVMCLDATADWEVLSGSVDHTVRMWDLETGKCKAQLLGHTRSVHCLALGQAQPQGPSMLFTGSRDHAIKIWDLRSQACEFTLHGHVGSVTCIGAEGWKLLSGGGYNRGADDDEVLSVDATLRLWDLRMLGSRQPCIWTKPAPSPEEPLHMQGPFNLSRGDPVLSLQLMQDQVLTSHGGKRWTARIWDLERGPDGTAERQGG